MKKLLILMMSVFLVTACGSETSSEKQTDGAGEVVNAEENSLRQEGKEDTRAIEERLIEDKENVVEASLYDGELTITHESGTLMSENSLMRVVWEMFENVNIAFADESINSVVIIIKTVMVDEKGNEESKPVVTYRYTRGTFEQLNYENFSDISMNEEWRVLNESDGYFIHPSVRSNLKSEYTRNLR